MGFWADLKAAGEEGARQGEALRKAREAGTAPPAPGFFESLRQGAEEGKANREAKEAAKREARAADPSKRRFSEVSTDGACPKCGGTSFKAKRSARGKLLAAGAALVVTPVALAAAPKSRVRCVTCKTEYLRG